MSGRSSKRKRSFFDIEIGKKPAGRVVFELFDDVVPKTASNFFHLCVGDRGRGISGKPLHYKRSMFHRVIKGFMVQGGDFTMGNGRGGESIYGAKFRDENFRMRHSEPYLLSMANSGRDTNGSQFFITCRPTPHLDGKHVVFGRVVQGEKVVRAIETVRTSRDMPVEPVVIADCGALLNDGGKVEDGSGSDADTSESGSGSSGSVRRKKREKKRRKKERKRRKKERKRAKKAAKRAKKASKKASRKRKRRSDSQGSNCDPVDGPGDEKQAPPAEPDQASPPSPPPQQPTTGPDGRLCKGRGHAMGALRYRPRFRRSRERWGGDGAVGRWSYRSERRGRRRSSSRERCSPVRKQRRITLKGSKNKPSVQGSDEGRGGDGGLDGVDKGRDADAVNTAETRTTQEPSATKPQRTRQGSTSSASSRSSLSASRGSRRRRSRSRSSSRDRRRRGRRGNESSSSYESSSSSDS